MSRVRVVGSGVVGLTCALALAEAGHAVEVVAADPPAATVSMVAGGLWYPYLARPQERVDAWGAEAFGWQVRLAEAEPAAGVRLVDGTEVGRDGVPEPVWAGVVRDFRVVEDPVAARAGRDGTAWAFTVPLVDMTVHLPWLLGRVRALGGTVRAERLAVLPDDGVPTVLAVGSGAAGLLGDTHMSTARGQVLLVAPDTPALRAIDRWWLDASAPTYVFPHHGRIVVGGTDTVDDVRPDPDPEISADVLDRAVALVPALAEARTWTERVGLRPVREEVRLETEVVGSTPVVHCYGHGGAGVTLAAGCAREVAERIAALEG